MMNRPMMQGQRPQGMPRFQNQQNQWNGPRQNGPGMPPNGPPHPQHRPMVNILSDKLRNVEENPYESSAILTIVNAFEPLCKSFETVCLKSIANISFRVTRAAWDQEVSGTIGIVRQIRCIKVASNNHQIVCQINQIRWCKAHHVDRHHNKCHLTICMARYSIRMIRIFSPRSIFDPNSF